MRNDLKNPEVMMENQNSINFNPDMVPMEDHALVETLRTF